ncbi:MAG: ABC transporter ATP-binding protein [Peptococcaceae bacterium]|nr:ABC transporter ATP-binding protein [Peptococcaceae bacterium]
MEIRTEKVSVRIGDATIIQDLTAKVDNREFVGIVGPNGSGKSTFLKTIYRVLKPCCGAVMLDGKPLSGITLKESAKKLGVMTQISTLNFDFTVEEVVLMGRTPHKKMLEGDSQADYELAYGSLAKVGMLEFARRKFNTLSGGERQRVLIARALTQQPDALILDEPTNHLDIQYQIQLLETVKGLGIEVFAAMHDLNLAACYCHRLYVMSGGRIVASGKPAEVLTEDLLHRVFSVRAKVTRDTETDRLNILYLGL